MTTTTKFAPPRIERRGAMLIAGVGGHYTSANRHRLHEQWARFGATLAALPGRVGQAEYGVSSMTEDGFDYLTGVEVSDPKKVPEGLRVLKLPAQRYAVFAHEGHVSAIPETCEAIGRDWLPKSGHQAAGPPEIIERYGEDFDPEEGTGGIEVWLPLKG
jgi:AraC family transcriptional regulator